MTFMSILMLLLEVSLVVTHISKLCYLFVGFCMTYTCVLHFHVIGEPSHVTFLCVSQMPRTPLVSDLIRNT